MPALKPTKLIFKALLISPEILNVSQFSDWLEEECGNLARKGLRTLVVGVKYLEMNEYLAFAQRYEAAKRSVHDRDASMRNAVEDLECNLELLGLTGVEDKLQDQVWTIISISSSRRLQNPLLQSTPLLNIFSRQVSSTLETLRNAGVRVWMLTGDKVETATCIAISSHLFARSQPYFTLQARSKEEAEEQFNRFQKRPGACLIIDGASLSLCTDNFARQFIEVRSPAVSVTRPLCFVMLPHGPLKPACERLLHPPSHTSLSFQVACNCPSVVCCRCAPTQKALIVRLLKLYAKKRCAAIGDGGNDVAMIQVRAKAALFFLQPDATIRSRFSILYPVLFNVLG